MNTHNPMDSGISYPRCSLPGSVVANMVKTSINVRMNSIPKAWASLMPNVFVGAVTPRSRWIWEGVRPHKSAAPKIPINANTIYFRWSEKVWIVKLVGYKLVRSLAPLLPSFVRSFARLLVGPSARPLIRSFVRSFPLSVVVRSFFVRSHVCSFYDKLLQSKSEAAKRVIQFFSLKDHLFT